MKAEHRIKRHIIRSAEADDPETYSFGDLETAEAIDAAYDRLNEDDLGREREAEIRGGQFATGLPAPYSRNYESKSVAAKLDDGTWVGWTYWYGGGKHAEPESIDWISEAYDLDCREEEKLVVVRTFARRSADAALTPPAS